MSRSYPPPKLNRTQTRLVESAAALFRQNGYEEVEVCDIAQQAGVAPSTFYYYFKNKHEVFQCYLNQNDQRIEAELQKLSGCSQNICAGLANFFGRIMSDLLQQDGRRLTHYRMLTLQFKSDPDSYFCRSLRAIVERAQQNGELSRAHSPDKIAFYLLLTFRGATYEWCTKQTDLDLGHLCHESISLTLRAFR